VATATPPVAIVSVWVLDADAAENVDAL